MSSDFFTPVFNSLLLPLFHLSLFAFFLLSASLFSTLTSPRLPLCLTYTLHPLFLILPPVNCFIHVHLYTHIEEFGPSLVCAKI